MIQSILCSIKILLSSIVILLFKCPWSKRISTLFSGPSQKKSFWKPLMREKTWFFDCCYTCRVLFLRLYCQFLFVLCITTGSFEKLCLLFSWAGFWQIPPFFEIFRPCFFLSLSLLNLLKCKWLIHWIPSFQKRINSLFDVFNPAHLQWCRLLSWKTNTPIRKCCYLIPVSSLVHFPSFIDLERK